MQAPSSVGNQPLIPLEEGWGHIKGGIQRLEDLLSTDFDGSVTPFTPAEYMAIYSCVLCLCCARDQLCWWLPLPRPV